MSFYFSRFLGGSNAFSNVKQFQGAMSISETIVCNRDSLNDREGQPAQIEHSSHIVDKIRRKIDHSISGRHSIYIDDDKECLRLKVRYLLREFKR